MASVPQTPVDEARVLADALGVVKVQLVAMRRHLVSPRDDQAFLGADAHVYLWLGG